MMTGIFELSGSTFRIGHVEYLLREREHPTKSKPAHYLVRLPNDYISSLWPQRDGRFRIDHTGGDGVERVYLLDFAAEPGYIRITGGDPSRRSGSSAPWHRPRV